MMGRSGTNSTVAAMELGTGLVAFAVGRAISDGVRVAQAMAGEDQAHAVGRKRYAAIIRSKKATMRAEAIDAAAKLNAARRRLHE